MAEDNKITLHGPPVTREMQLLFGAFGSSPVKGVCALSAGLHVSYEDGRVFMFYPVEQQNEKEADNG